MSPTSFRREHWGIVYCVRGKMFAFFFVLFAVAFPAFFHSLRSYSFPPQLLLNCYTSTMFSFLLQAQLSTADTAHLQRSHYDHKCIYPTYIDIEATNSPRSVSLFFAKGKPDPIAARDFHYRFFILPSPFFSHSLPLESCMLFVISSFAIMFSSFFV